MNNKDIQAQHLKSKIEEALRVFTEETGFVVDGMDFDVYESDDEFSYIVELEIVSE